MRVNEERGGKGERERLHVSVYVHLYDYMYLDVLLTTPKLITKGNVYKHTHTVYCIFSHMQTYATYRSLSCGSFKTSATATTLEKKEMRGRESRRERESDKGREGGSREGIKGEKTDD